MVDRNVPLFLCTPDGTLSHCLPLLSVGRIVSDDILNLKDKGRPAPRKEIKLLMCVFICLIVKSENALFSYSNHYERHFCGGEI